MSAPARGFAQSEFAARTARAQALMGEAGFDALLFTTEPEVRYFTGYLTRFWESPTRPWFLILPRMGKPVAVIPGIGAELMGRTWIDDIRTWRAPDLKDDGVSLLAEALRELSGDKARIGVPMGHETHLRMPLGDFFRLQRMLPDVLFEDATAIVRTQQQVKSEAEIARIAHACQVASGVFEAMDAIARPGKALDAVFRDFQAALLGGGADWVPYVAGGAGPGGYGDVISPASGDPLKAGDVLMLDTGAVFDGYFCDFDRNYAIAHADDAARRGYEVLYAATDAGFAAAKPGATAADVWRAMQDVISTAGDAGEGGRLGHGLGMRLTEWPSLIEDDDTVLEPGMVLTLEPGLEIAPGCMQVHEENIVVRENGAQWLTRRAPAELPVIG
ncbi:MAG: aminopeptidase P family protein [Rhodobiaceae bacterium]|nr:aminopeptidase P family protein [Rhodobiaceae bacterium]